MASKQSLLERFDIPINHLDYQYIDGCHNPKEMEKIVLILRSGQEGYFPDLTRHAEERLKMLKPGSKVLRTETPLLTKELMESGEWNELNDPIKEWIGDMREKDRLLVKVTEKEPDMMTNVPPIRKNCGKIDPCRPQEKESSKPKVERIQSTDYDKWDKFDADTEVLKMDLEEERAREEVERMNRLNLKNSASLPATSIESFELNNLTEVEKENLCLKYKERGNDYFRAKEYKEAVEEYTKCILVLPTVNGYNNRALTYLKLDEIDKCVEDCDQSLQLDPKNVKALLRKAKAYNDSARYRMAYDLLKDVLLIDPQNIAASKELADLRQKIPDLPPVSATRMRIIEEDSVTNPEQKENTASEHILKQEFIKPKDSQQSLTSKESTVSKNGKVALKGSDNDLSKLIMPNKIVKSKLKSTVEAIGKIQKETKKEFTSAVDQKLKSQSEVTIIPESRNKPNRKLVEEL